ncbi:type III secretion system stator protein SctL [Yersinia bercovieri]|uniref:type III secretion system stator protein SctL n=1 Tax=Yersinia bercovieri TaxID=634 RepID=UPI0005E5D8FB|nr:type III secretion system stator protein SctL [Yersinia bercovieri]MDN0103751.1 type III secretion system stator protein SctL [Yersinia bercovieri]CFQ38416.1 type III secretion apparatus protein%2C HrpE/YscL family [Yersinia bercovieri]CNI99008.1 type III secretion apparatus protein%2C HrpE/YscL family [Yersinia bercovieri]
MNPFHLRVEVFDYPLPTGVIIPAMQLQKMTQCRDMLSDAHRQAAEILQAASAEKAQLLAQAEQQAEQLIDQTRSQIEADVLAQHIRWLVTADQLTSSLVTQARQQILTAITSVLTAWAGQQAVDQMLIQHLGAQVEALAQEDGLVLRVHPQHLSAVTVALGGRVPCLGDECLAEDEAQLASPLLQISFSLHRHLAQLFLWLQLAPPPQQELTHDHCE